MKLHALLEKAVSARRESKYVDFKQKFDVGSKQDWCEVIKDMVAMANSGGGVIVVGVDDNGRVTGEDVSSVLQLDPATITDKIHKYTGTHFSEFSLEEATRETQKIAALVFGQSPVPMVFTKPGTYPIAGGKQKTAFSLGTVYFRHGAKSEPGTTKDLEQVINRRLGEIRKEWLKGVRRAVQAPPGAEVTIVHANVRATETQEATPIRVVDDPSAPAFRMLDPDTTHPYRQKELIREVLKGLPQGTKFNTHDVLALRKVHKIDERTELTHKPKFGTRQYSPACVTWFVERFRENNRFYTEARADFYKMTHGGGSPRT